MKTCEEEFYRHILIFLFISEQADPETDEVYAQMTLQPVTKVGLAVQPENLLLHP